MPGTCELAGLRDADIQSSESHQFAGSVEASDISNFTEDDGAQSIANAWDGGDIAAGLLQQHSNLLFQLSNLSF